MLYDQKLVKQRIEEASKKLHLDAQKMLAEFGVTTALAEMLEKEVEHSSPTSR